jgi:hypothetical protein
VNVFEMRSMAVLGHKRGAVRDKVRALLNGNEATGPRFLTGERPFSLTYIAGRLRNLHFQLKAIARTLAEIADALEARHE